MMLYVARQDMLKKSLEIMFNGYKNDPDLTAFTKLDGENYYEIELDLDQRRGLSSKQEKLINANISQLARRSSKCFIPSSTESNSITSSFFNFSL